MPEFLVISALGEDKTGILRALSQAATQNGCNILDTRMTVLGGEFALLMLIEGEPTDIAQAEQSLASVADQYQLTIIQKRTQPKKALSSSQNFSISVNALDHPGIVSEITGFLSDRQINIEEMETGTYPAPHTGSPMFSLLLSIRLPSSVDVAIMEEELVSYCDERNLDVILTKQ